MKKVLALIFFCTIVSPPACSPEYETFNGSEIRPNTTCVSFDLNGAVLRKADLRGANLTETRLNRTDLRGALYDKDTVFSISIPKGFDPEGAGLVLKE